ncbi:MAG: hypothetical protein AB7S77_02075 [Desulfatirhabdiaceae bacterium]
MNTLPDLISNGKGMPCYELWARNYGPDNLQLEIWQLPSAGTPHIKQPLRIAGLHGRNLALVEHRVLRRLARAGIRLGGLTQIIQKYPLHEDLSLTLGLLFRVLAPMRSRQNMQMVTDGIEAMGQEEAAYWLGMAMHRKHPRRVLMALRFLLIDPKATGGKDTGSSNRL